MRAPVKSTLLASKQRLQHTKTEEVKDPVAIAAKKKMDETLAKIDGALAAEKRLTDNTPKAAAPKCDDQPTVEPNAGGMYELSPRMSNILEKELKNIMIKIWQVLPDDAPSEADKLVIDKLKNKAGDDLRNVLGLNATKRLLNIHNPLNAKIVFHKRPIGPDVKAFIQKYNIRALKKVDNQINTFAIQFKSINDFDRLVTAKDVRCGDVKVTVTSCYKFTQCPDKIKTIYYERPEEKKSQEQPTLTDKKTETETLKTKEDNKTESTKATEEVKDSKFDKTNSVDSKTTEKTVDQTEKNKEIHKKLDTKVSPVKNANITTPLSKETLKKSETENSNTEIKKASTAKETVPVATKESKPNSKITDNVNQVSKPNEINAVTNKATSNKSVGQNVSSNISIIQIGTPSTSVNQKPLADNTSASLKATINKSVSQKAPTMTIVSEKAPLKSTGASSKAPLNKNVGQKAPVKTDQTLSTYRKLPLNAIVCKKASPKVAPEKRLVTKAKPKPKPAPKKSKKMEDNDELDDHEILALLSGGIVIDECSGSDVE